MTTTSPRSKIAETKHSLLSHYGRLAALATEGGMKTFAEDIIHERISKIEAESFHLVVLGEFNHGKSTFVNALLGAPVLPVGITPTTAAINHVIYAATPRARVILRSGQVTPITLEELPTWTTVTGGRAEEIRFIEVGYPAQILRDKITLVDTPGVNDLNEQRAEITYGYLPLADAVVFLLDAGQALKESEREFLASHVVRGSVDRLTFVLGKVDLLSESERADVTAYAREGLAKLCPGAPVFAVSAKHWLDNKMSSGFPELLDHLNRVLATDRARIVVDNGCEDAVRSGNYIAQNLGVKLRAYELDVVELESRVARVRAELEASQKTLNELQGKIRAEASAIKGQARLDLEGFSRHFVEVLPEQIDKVDSEDLKKYLGGFIEAKFKEWTELEGAKISALLEHLAEEVIAVTNENVAAMSSQLAAHIGSTDTEVQIDIDSFKYDVGVYAAGALGTTVMLFVNGLAGGLMTLAVPILALVVKSKVAGDIKEQAKERVSGVVFAAADAMEPHLEKTVDDFASRLATFVTTAGNTLYQGIREVLEETLDERRRAGAEVDGLRNRCTQQRDEVVAIVEQLAQLRADLWTNEGATSTDDV